MYALNNMVRLVFYKNDFKILVTYVPQTHLHNVPFYKVFQMQNDGNT